MKTKGTMLAISAVILAGLALFIVLPDSAEAAPVIIDGCSYELDVPAEGEATLVGAEGVVGDFYIPAVVAYGTDTYAVTAIGAGAIPRTVYSLTIGENIESIDEDAFIMSNLVEFDVDPDNEKYEIWTETLYTVDHKLVAYPVGNTRADFAIRPDTVEICTKAFQFAGSLTTVEVADTVTKIGDYAFRYCSSLTEVTLPDTVTDMGIGVFANCFSLTDLPDLPSSEIKENTFFGCIGLRDLIIDESITYVGPSAFGNCTKISYLRIHEDCHLDDTAFEGLTVRGPSGNVIAGDDLAGHLYYGSGTDKTLYDSTTGYTITFEAGERASSTKYMTTVDGKLPSLPTYSGLIWDYDTWYMRDGTEVTTDTVFTADTTLYTSSEVPEEDPLNDNLILGGIAIALMVGFVVYIIATARRF